MSNIVDWSDTNHLPVNQTHRHTTTATFQHAILCHRSTVVQMYRTTCSIQSFAKNWHLFYEVMFRNITFIYLCVVDNGCFCYTRISFINTRQANSWEQCLSEVTYPGRVAHETLLEAQIDWLIKSPCDVANNEYCHLKDKKHLKNVGPISHNEPPHAHSQMLLAVLSRAACASMSTTTTTRDRWDRYGPMKWANESQKHTKLFYRQDTMNNR